MVLKVTQIAPEMIFVKPEVTWSNRKCNFYNRKLLLWVIQSVFNACKGLLRAQKLQNITFLCINTLKCDINIPQIYFNDPLIDSNCTRSDFCETGSDIIKPELKFL